MEHESTADVGGRLQQARERCGLSLRDAARVTKLTLDVVRAIEGNEFDRLPPGMYRKAYVRMLAAEVGLDANEIADEYSRLCEPPPPPPIPVSVGRGNVLREQLIRQLSASSRPSVVLVIALLAVVTIWFLFGISGAT